MYLEQDANLLLAESWRKTVELVRNGRLGSDGQKGCGAYLVKVAILWGKENPSNQRARERRRAR